MVTSPADRLYRLPSMTEPASPRRDMGEERRTALLIWLAGCPFLLGSGLLLFERSGLVIGGVIALLVPAVMVIRSLGAGQRELVAELPDALDGVARSLRSGAPFAQALDEAAASQAGLLGDELGQLRIAMMRGASVAAVVGGWIERWPDPAVRVAGAALAIAATHQEGAAQSLEGVAQTLRDRTAMIDEVASHASQAKASLHALVFLPGAFLALDGLGGQRTVRFLVTDPIGQRCLVLGVVLNIIGWLWITALTRRRLPA